MRAMVAGKPVSIRNPDAIRPWQHVLEPLAGYLTLAERLHRDGPEYAEAWNFGPDESSARPVSWIVEHLVRLWGEDARWEADEGEHPHEAHYLKLDCSKARMRLGTQPRLDLPTALEWIVDWNRAWLRGEDMRGVTERQIEEYDSSP